MGLSICICMLIPAVAAMRVLIRLSVKEFRNHPRLAASRSYPTHCYKAPIYNIIIIIRVYLTWEFPPPITCAEILVHFSPFYICPLPTTTLNWVFRNYWTTLQQVRWGGQFNQLQMFVQQIFTKFTTRVNIERISGWRQGQRQ